MFRKTAKSAFVAVACAGACLALASGIGFAQAVDGQAVGTESSEFEAAPPILRRLTESQYRASIADVFGPEVPIAGRFERGLRVDGLIAVGTSRMGMSPFSLEQYDIAARSVASAVTSDEMRERFVPCRPVSEAAFDRACATQFVDTYGSRLFRRPLTQEQLARFVGIAESAQAQLGGFYNGLNYALVGMLVSPEFLLRIERVEPVPGSAGKFRLDAFSKASRLSYFLTNSTPDDELLQAAANGKLHTSAGLRRQVDRLIASDQVENSVRAFFADMLHFDGFRDLFKDPEIYPYYTTQVALDAQEQTLRTIVSHLITDKGDYRDLFTTRNTWLTRSLGMIYRMRVTTRNGWERAVYPEDSGRAGILTDLSMLALHSHPGRSSPTLRGKAIRENLLCERVPDPPADVDFAAFQDAAAEVGSTARIRLAEHNANPVCAGCHKITDPIGLSLESFDGAAVARAVENGVKLDLSGSLYGEDFDGPVGLGKAMRNSESAPHCLVEKMYRSAVGRELLPTEEPVLEDLSSQFVQLEYRVPMLMREIVLSQSFFAISASSDPETRRTAQTIRNGDRS